MDLNTFLRRLVGRVRAAFPRRKPKTARRERGDAGEDFAAKFLRREGAKILLRNWRHGHDEIDIVALDGDCLVFVEVKTRSETDPHGGYAAVDAHKRAAQKRAARAYLDALRERPPAHRFDVVEVFVRESDGAMRAVHHRAVPFSRRYSN
ncbi:MAG: YraN family protein [Candidatus Spyradosoma sp.]